jgi:hypothetical protein
VVLFSCKSKENEYDKNNELTEISIPEDNANEGFHINDSIEETESIIASCDTVSRDYFWDVIINVYYDFEPLIIDIKINDEIWFNGAMSVYNGWPPNVRMIVNDNKLIGIKEELIPKELYENVRPGMTIEGSYKLKYLYETGLPYYDDPLLVFEIIEYKNIEIIGENNVGKGRE